CRSSPDLSASMCSPVSVLSIAAYWQHWIRRARLATHRLLDRFDNTIRLERLDDEVFRSCLDRIDYHRLLAHRRAHDNLGVRIDLLDLFQSSDPIHLWHRNIHRYEVWSQLFELLDRLRTVARFTYDFVAVLRQDVFDHHSHECCVVYY